MHNADGSGTHAQFEPFRQPAEIQIRKVKFKWRVGWSGGSVKSWEVQNTTGFASQFRF